MAYAAYLRIYEPASAFHEPDRSRWVAYADSSTRPRRRDSLAVEHAEALRRAITTPQAAVPERESEHAYIRRADGITYVCPWQTRLRCLLALVRPGEAGPARLVRAVRPGRGRPLAGGIPPVLARRARLRRARAPGQRRCAPRGSVGGRDPRCHRQRRP